MAEFDTPKNGYDLNIDGKYYNTLDIINILAKNMRPVYDSARRQGYEIWNR